MGSFSKFKISSKQARFFSTMAVSLVTMLIVFFLTNFVMERSLRVAEKNYIETCESVVDGYSNAIYYYLENYHTSLSSICNKPLFYQQDAGKIQNWITENAKFVHEDLCVVFYATKDGKAYFSNDRVEDVSDAVYLQEAKSTKDDYLTSDVYDSKYTDEQVIIISEPIYRGDEFLGVFCGGILLEKFQKITDEMKIGESGSVYLLDSTGRFITNPNKDLVGKRYKPENEKYSSTSTSIISKSGCGSVETVNAAGEVINLFFENIKDCNWTLTVGFYKKELSKIYSQQNILRFIVILISLGSLLFLLLIEMRIIDYFHSKQIISMSYDTLTNLWTRQKFELEAAKIIRRNPNAIFMLVEADIRGFKFINQNYGSAAADKAIVFLSSEMNKFARVNHGIIGRGYADCFYLLLKVKGVTDAMKVFDKELSSLIENVKAYEIPFFPKLGITFFRARYSRKISVCELINQASFAKSTIKNNMQANYAIYNERMTDKANEENFIELGMEKALGNNEFFVMYQPKISLEDDKIVGAEALVRWNSPERGIITPDNFIPIFERNNSVQKLDYYVYDKVFAFIDRQLKEGKKIVPISVNMSRNHNKPEKFVQDFMRIFNKYNIPPKYVQVEIIERSVMDNSALYDITERLHAQGFTVAMDDFGTGESSLSMLTKVPVDVLKFDREFLVSSTDENGEMDEKSANFISVLISLGKHLDKETVFEGVETEKQRDFLRSIRCDQVQGFFYSKPLSEEEFIKFMEEH